MTDLAERRPGTLRRDRPRPPSVPAVDGFRGLAVLWILLGHCWNELGGRIPLDGGPLRHIFTSSYMGVDMLFIVSGFVLFLPVVVNGTVGDVRSYALRRAARIVPAFYVALVFSAIVAGVLDARRIGIGDVVSHLLFVHGEAHHYTDIGFGVNGALWTMSVEVVFYAILPIVASWYARRPFVGLAIAVLGTEAWHLAATKLPAILAAGGIEWSGIEQGQVRMALAFPSYAVHFAVGMTAAWLYVRLSARPSSVSRRRLAFAAQTAALFGSIGIFYLRGWEGHHGISGPLDHWTKTADRVFLFAVLVLATSLATRRAQWPVRNTASRFMGSVCYGTYLVHLPLITLLIPALGLAKGTTSNADLLVLMAVAAPLSIVIGYASFVLLEEPFRRWARRVRRAEPSRHEPPVVLATAPG